MHPLVFIHICAATVSMLAGFMAIAFRKGSGLHHAAGTVFFGSMLVMSSSAAYLGAFHKPIMINVIAALLTFYLVCTAWVAARRRDGGTGMFDRVALLFVVIVGSGAVIYGFDVAQSPRGMRNGMPAAIYFMFGTVALLFAASDIRMLKRGGVAGMQRIARHLWRMCFALLITTLSFYPGQARQFPRWLRDTNVFFVPHILLIGAMIFWMYRVRVRKRLRAGMLAGAGQPA